MQHCLSRLILFIGIFLLATTAWATPGINMPYGVSPISHEIYNLHMACFYICCVIGAGVFGVLIYSLIKFRKSKGAKAVHFHEHLGIEILWTTIPFLILVALAIPATIVLQHIHNTDESALTVKITGYQWKWKYEYLDQGVSFFSLLSTPQDQINNKAPKNEWFLLEVDKPLVVPVNTKVKLLITSDDVIHAWWVPELGVKQDAVPGFINENWIYVSEPGMYRGQCGELCGINHGFMPIVVKAVSQAEFAKWVTQNQNVGIHITNKTPLKTMTQDQLLTMGKAQYEKSCAMCHQNSGEGLPPSFPALKKSKITTGSAAGDITFVMQGSPGTAMQAFGEQLDDTALAAVITYTRHSWDNDKLNTKRKNVIVVQPQDVQNIRNSKK
jgi:cytochrome c oxidase subunit 2